MNFKSVSEVGGFLARVVYTRLGFHVEILTYNIGIAFQTFHLVNSLRIQILISYSSFKETFQNYHRL